MGTTIRTRALQALVLVSLSVLASCSATRYPLLEIEKPEAGNTDLDQVRAYGAELLRVAQEQDPASGFAAIAIGPEGVVWSDSVGFMTGTQQVPVTLDTPMHLGSITKPFTALAIIQLVEQGKVDLDANLRTYLPEFSIHSRFGNGDFTIRQMLTHYSGLPSDLLNDFFAEPAALRTAFEQTVARAAETHLKSRPDLIHSYSNLAYQLLGVVIERVSGETYDQYITQHIFAPLGMQHSAVLVQDANGAWPALQGVADPRALGYALISNLSAGAIVSSANDMGRFVQMLIDKGAGIVSRDSFREMLRVQDEHVTLGGGGQGLGFFISRPAAPTQRAWHGGSLPGHSALMTWRPDARIGVVVLESSSAGRDVTSLIGGNVAQAIEQAVLPARATPSVAPAIDVASAPHATQTGAVMSDAERYTGLYFGPGGPGLMTINDEQGALTLRFLITRLAKVNLIPRGNDAFAPNVKALGFIPVPVGLVTAGVDEAEVQFLFDGDRRYVMLEINGTNPVPLAVSMPEQQVSVEWLRRMGSFAPVVGADKSIVHGINLHFDAKNGIPLADALTEGQTVIFPLELLSGTQAATAGFGRYAGEVIEFVSDDEFVFGGARFVRTDVGIAAR